MTAHRKQRITILGSTGSIGASTIDVMNRHPDRYETYALTANTGIDALAAQCERLLPDVAVVGDADGARRLEMIFREKGIHTEVAYGAEALCAVASASTCDVVMAAIVGGAGLGPTLAAAKAGKKVLLANKEALVMSGQLFMDAIDRSGATLLPIDSEHNAVFQCLPRTYDRHPDRHGVAKVLLTASGGPFLGRDIATMDHITPEEAVAHPKWVMGRKISVDSATMMNKGLEVIEAHWIFNVPAERIEVVIHPQSVIHSMVSYIDGSVIAQMGNPDMRTPIANALAFPDRIDSGVAQLDLVTTGRLEFLQPDLGRFPCLKLAYDALRVGGCAPAVLNAANEIAVAAFLDRRIGFRKIDRIIDSVMQKTAVRRVEGIDDLLALDADARTLAHSII